jgi:trans-aconitate methyltransferase
VTRAREAASSGASGAGLDAQDWSATGYAANARFVADLATPVLDLLAPRPGEHVLDLGCGDGVLTAAIAQAGAQVVGVDGSPDMVRAACARGLDARVMDGQNLMFSAAFDAVFSNAALHWMPDAGAVVAGVARALKPGGRFVGEMGGHGNVAAIVVALHAALRLRGHHSGQGFSWYFPTAEAYRALLEQHGFTVRQAQLIPRPTLLPTGISGWLTTFATPFLRGIPAAEHAAILAEAEALLARPLRSAAGDWIADYVRLRFSATLA